MKVQLIAYTPDAERVVATAARLCYASASVDEVLEKASDETETREFLERLAALGHESPIEHVSFTFAIQGVSRALLAQITRHRIASYSVRSQRYVSEKAFQYVTPPEIADVPEAKALFEASMERARQDYVALSEILAKNRAKKLEAEGMEPKAALTQARKQSREDARFVLPGGCDTQMLVTMNARSLRNFFRQRCCNRAQWEIRAVAWEMLRQVQAVCPTLFAGAGPACVSGGCKEGAMSCGKAEEVRAKYAKLQEKV